jgi:hypothetical protein
VVIVDGHMHEAGKVKMRSLTWQQTIAHSGHRTHKKVYKSITKILNNSMWLSHMKLNINFIVIKEYFFQNNILICFVTGYNAVTKASVLHYQVASQKYANGKRIHQVFPQTHHAEERLWPHHNQTRRQRGFCPAEHQPQGHVLHAGCPTQGGGSQAPSSAVGTTGSYPLLAAMLGLNIVSKHLCLIYSNSEACLY